MDEGRLTMDKGEILRCAQSDKNVYLKGDSEIFVSWVGRDFFDFGFPYVAGERFLYITYATIYILSLSLSEHLNSAIRDVADKTCYLMAIGYVMSSETKANPLNPANENYVFCNHIS